MYKRQVLCDSSDCVNGYDLTAGVKSSGTYYVAVRSESAYGTPEGSYTLRLSYSAGGTDGIELEPNDSKSVSQSLSLTTPLEGTISSGDDADWYAFDVSGAGQLTLNIETEQYTYYGFEVFILDAADNILESVLCESSDCVNVYDLTLSLKHKRSCSRSNLCRSRW